MNNATVILAPDTYGRFHVSSMDVNMEFDTMLDAARSFRVPVVCADSPEIREAESKRYRVVKAQSLGNGVFALSGPEVTSTGKDKVGRDGEGNLIMEVIC